MSIEEYVKKSREELRLMFGEVEAKKDCKYYKEDLRKQNDCMVCVKQPDKNRLQCECGVCYFYSKNV